MVHCVMILSEGGGGGGGGVFKRNQETEIEIFLITTKTSGNLQEIMRIKPQLVAVSFIYSYANERIKNAIE